MVKRNAKKAQRSKLTRPTDARIEKLHFPSWEERERFVREIQHAATVLRLPLEQLLKIVLESSAYELQDAAGFLHRSAVGHEFVQLHDRIRRLEEKLAGMVRQRAEQAA